MLLLNADIFLDYFFCASTVSKGPLEKSESNDNNTVITTNSNCVLTITTYIYLNSQLSIWVSFYLILALTTSAFNTPYTRVFFFSLTVSIFKFLIFTSTNILFLILCHMFEHALQTDLEVLIILKRKQKMLRDIFYSPEVLIRKIWARTSSDGDNYIDLSSYDEVWLSFNNLFNHSGW